jgi:transcriptional regulator with XRE-family HTH domain
MSSFMCVLKEKRRLFANVLGICETCGMDELMRNIRYLLWKEGADRKDWPSKLAEWLGCPLQRAEGLLEGEGRDPVTSKEKKFLEKATGLAPEELSGDLLEKHDGDILVENIRHLIDGLPHGQKKEFAAKLGVDVTTVSRWIGGAQRPTKKKLEEIGKYFGLPPGTDLDSEAIFLWTEPISESQMKHWITEHIQRMEGNTLREIFPALRRLFTK